jgi:flavin reductase (DIM6/NTAB) family NADH-FMN oxidoreductase RutF
VAFDSNVFKAAMRRYPTGVTVVTSLHKNEPRGMTANAFASVSADPSTVLVCVNREARSYLYIASSRIFCVNVLSAEQRALAERFAAGMRDQQFEGIAHRRAVTGAPILDGTLAYFDCEVEQEHHAGSHSIFIGHVVDCAFSSSGSPLGYFDGTFQDFDLKIE